MFCSWMNLSKKKNDVPITAWHKQTKMRLVFGCICTESPMLHMGNKLFVQISHRQVGICQSKPRGAQFFQLIIFFIIDFLQLVSSNFCCNMSTFDDTCDELRLNMSLLASPTGFFHKK